MCDTLFKRFSFGSSIFAKNSDRDPQEPQITELALPGLPDEENYFFPQRQDYLEKNYPALKEAFNKLNPEFTAIISRPSWIWGAEMGVNEKGVAIGNEAVFSLRGRLFDDGLLGMDILRLTLHAASSASEAVEIIISLINTYGQGGNCAFRGKLKYHNSFLIADAAQGFVLETAGMDWAVKTIRSYYSISNTYTIRDDFDRISTDKVLVFKQHFEAKFYNLFTRAVVRRKYTMTELEKLQQPFEVRRILRSHIKNDQPRPTMASVCMHSPRLIKSETTASMIVEYVDDEFLVWTTNSPLPCLSVYKPLDFSFARENELFSPARSMDMFLQRRILTRRLLEYPALAGQFRHQRDQLEHECYESLEDFRKLSQARKKEIYSRCWGMEQELVEKFLKQA